ncbi:MAG: 30S ribosomal protein S20, partial [Candidatus Nealsonbacteria bacterium]|nr:30S ribosomal protein S20 [Candidatus Nealsonbacteria bacterium]
MAIIKSAKKALRQSIKRRARNLVYINRVKKLTKEVGLLFSQKKIKELK